MSIIFFCGSGSPYAWKVWLALEHKELPYEKKMLSFQAGDLNKPEYLAVNPRAQVPAIVDGDLTLFESSAIVEYLDDRYPERPVIGRDPMERAIGRRIVAEVDAYLFPASRKLFAQTLFIPPGTGDPKEIAAAQGGLHKELARFEAYATGSYLVGDGPTVADYTLYPMLALIRRVEAKHPGQGVGLPPKLEVFSKKIEALPHFAKTIPPHWKS
jgi:glutathione S-transferase